MKKKKYIYPFNDEDLFRIRKAPMKTLEQIWKPSEKVKEELRLLDEVKEKMSKARSIEEYNLFRGEIKMEYPLEIVSRLDASGFINVIKKEQEWKQE